MQQPSIRNQERNRQLNEMTKNVDNCGLVIELVYRFIEQQLLEIEGDMQAIDAELERYEVWMNEDYQNFQYYNRLMMRATTTLWEFREERDEMWDLLDSLDLVRDV